MSPLYFKIFLIALPFVLYMQIISPLYSGGGQLYVPETNIKDARAVLSQYDSAIKTADKLIKDANSLRADYESFDDATKATLNTMIPTGVNPVLLLDEVTELMNQTGVDVDGISQNITTSTLYPKLGVYTISMAVNGGYDDFKKALRQIQNSLRIYDIEAVTFIPPEKDGEVAKMQVALKTYFLK